MIGSLTFRGNLIFPYIIFVNLSFCFSRRKYLQMQEYCSVIMERENLYLSLNCIYLPQESFTDELEYFWIL